MNPPYEPAGVPAAPNASRVTGRVLRTSPVPGGGGGGGGEGEGGGSVWELELTEAADVPGLANLARSRVGRPVQVYVHPELQTRVGPGDVVRATVSYQGDERSGAFFLQELGHGESSPTPTRRRRPT